MALASPWRLTPSTMASSTHCIKPDSCLPRLGRLLSGKLEPDLAVTFRVVPPALAHLDEQEQMHRMLDDVGDLAPRFRTDRLDGLAALAQHDLALAHALDEDRLLDTHRAVLEFLPRIGLD